METTIFSANFANMTTSAGIPRNVRIVLSGNCRGTAPSFSKVIVITTEHYRP